MTTSHFSFQLLLPSHSAPSQHHLSHFFFISTRSRLDLRTQVQACDLLGDFGARDPFPIKIESEFGYKVHGNFSIEHKILIPNFSSLSFAQLQCSLVSPLQPLLLEEDARILLKKVKLSLFVYSLFFLLLQCLMKCHCEALLITLCKIEQLIMLLESMIGLISQN